MGTSDRDDLADLYSGQRDRLRRFAYILCGDAHIAEEIVQDAFVELHRRWGSVDNPAGYLRTSVANGCRSHHRRRAVERRWVAPRVQLSPEEAVHDDISQALSNLSGRQQAALAMRYYLDLPDEEIAATLHVRPSTVRSLLRRGLSALREELEP